MEVVFQLVEIIKISEKVTKRSIPVLKCPRRAGDPAVLVGSADKAKKILGWQPEYSDLRQIIDHAWLWHSRSIEATYF